MRAQLKKRENSHTAHLELRDGVADVVDEDFVELLGQEIGPEAVAGAKGWRVRGKGTKRGMATRPT